MAIIHHPLIRKSTLVSLVSILFVVVGITYADHATTGSVRGAASYSATSDLLAAASSSSVFVSSSSSNHLRGQRKNVDNNDNDGNDVNDGNNHDEASAVVADVDDSELEEEIHNDNNDNDENEVEDEDEQEKYVEQQAVPKYNYFTSTSNQRQSVQRRTSSITSSTSPSLTLSKKRYIESESISAIFRLGSMNDVYYADRGIDFANSNNNDETDRLDEKDRISTWTVGLFMRDADPQDGALEPIVGVPLCSNEGSSGGDDVDDGSDGRDYCTVSTNGDNIEGRVTFGGQTHATADGLPLRVADYGTGYDAYILDGRGAAMIGPFEFEIVEGEMEADSNSDMGNGMLNAAAANSGGGRSSTTTTQTGASHMASPPLSSTSSTALEERQQPQQGDEGEGYLRLDKTVITSSPNESLGVTFWLPPDSDGSMMTQAGEGNSEWKIGIFMRMARPQGGSLEPITSLKLCGRHICSHDEYLLQDNNNDPSLLAAASPSSSVVFEKNTASGMSGRDAGWPLNVLDYGTGYDVYLLDGDGNAILGPVKFNVALMDDDEENGEESSMIMSSEGSSRGSSPNSGGALQRFRKYNHNRTNKMYSSSHHHPSSSSTTATTTTTTPVATTTPSTLTTSKMAYAQEEPIIVTFSLGTDLQDLPDDGNHDDQVDEAVLATWQVGIFMRMANPQDGSLAPILSLPLTSLSSESSSADETYTVVFKKELRDIMDGTSTWPLNLLDYGTGYDVYLLDDSGRALFGPVMFNIISDDFM